MSVADIRKSAEQKMARSIESLKTGLSKVRTGRASTGLLDHVMVTYGSGLGAGHDQTTFV